MTHTPMASPDAFRSRRASQRRCSGGAFGYAAKTFEFKVGHAELIGLVEYDSKEGGAHGGLFGVGAGHFTFGSGDAVVSFVPDAPLPFDAIVVVELTSAITDVWDNALVDASGHALTVPLTVTLTTQ